MAKKSAHQSEPPTQAAGGSTTLAKALRAALDQLGIDAHKDEVSEFVKTNYPTVQYKESTFNSSLSSIRKKLKGESGHSNTQGITYKDLSRVKTLADSEGGIDQLLAQIDKVEAIANRVGGLSRLRGCLRGLKDLAK